MPPYIEAAHIHQFADSRNNDPRNGLALSKNAHWLFDNGLWALTDDYKVIVAEGEFAEAGASHDLLSAYHGKTILLPADQTLRPNPIHIALAPAEEIQGCVNHTPAATTAITVRGSTEDSRWTVFPLNSA